MSTLSFIKSSTANEGTKMYNICRLWSLLLSGLLVIFFANKLYAQDFVYTNDDVIGSNTISGFSVAGNGALTAVAGSPFATGGAGGFGGFYAANRVNSCVAGNFLYASNSNSGNVSGFSVNSSTGVLTPVPGSPFAAAGGSSFSGISLACTPNGQFVIAANSAGPITVFSIAGNGALTPVAGFPFASSSSPDGIKVSPDNKFLAVAEPGGNWVEMFSIAPNGSLTPVPGSPFPGGGGGGIAGVDINCASNTLFGGEANFGSTIVDVFSIAPSGALTPIVGSPFNPGVGSNSNVVLLSPDDQKLFVSNQDSSSVTVFTVGAGGSLALVPGSPFAAPGSYFPSGMATNRAGNFLYVADGSNAVYSYSIAGTGALTPVPGSPFATGQTGLLLSLTAFPAKACVIQVSIDIKPGSFPNSINPRNQGVIPVAILTTSTFDATTVDPLSVKFGPNGAKEAHGRGHIEDVDGDGDLDLVLHFSTQATGIQCGDTSASLTGKTFGGQAITGSDSIRTVGC